MHLARLHVHQVRNLQEIVLKLHPRLNFFVGENASGKTSLLEAIHLLAVGRSFRSNQTHTIINYHHNALACFAEIEDGASVRTTIGIEKNRQGAVTCKLGGKLCTRLSQLAIHLPLQLMTPETFKLLQAGAEERRRFLDWGVFHVEQSFTELCQRYQRLLKQRNATLKQKHWRVLHAWEKEFIAAGEKISQLRKSYLASFMPFFEEIRQGLLPQPGIAVEYEQGWPVAVSLEEALQGVLEQDQRWGYTSVGPHRADLILKLDKYRAVQVLSRGQQKLFISALLLAQAQHLYHTKGNKCLFLLDDLASELDSRNRQKLLTFLFGAQHQIFLTGVDESAWGAITAQLGGLKFHVEQGQVELTSHILRS